MSKTDDNLKAAFAGESQANRKYLAFAKAADAEGQPQVARLFRAAAEAETIHAHGHLAAMGGIGDTEGNLQEAIAGETHEFTDMYPEFIAAAEAEGNQKALRMFRLANAVEEIHAGLYRKYHQAVTAGSKVAETNIFVCGACGNTVEGAAPEKCPVCGAAAEFFIRIECPARAPMVVHATTPGRLSPEPGRRD